jgi:hypothetical protein
MRKIKIKETVGTEENRRPSQLLEQGICPACFAPEIITKKEQRDEARFETVSYCGKCGATFA